MSGLGHVGMGAEGIRWQVKWVGKNADRQLELGGIGGGAETSEVGTS